MNQGPSHLATPLRVGNGVGTAGGSGVGPETRQTRNETMNQYAKPNKS